MSSSTSRRTVTRCSHRWSRTMTAWRCKGDAREMQGRWWPGTRRSRRRDVGEVQGRCRGDLGEMTAWHAAISPSRCGGGAGEMQGRSRGDDRLARGDLAVDLVDETAQRRRALAGAARGAGSGGQEAGLGSYLRYISATSPLYLRYISAISPLIRRRRRSGSTFPSTSCATCARCSTGCTSTMRRACTSTRRWPTCTTGRN